MPEYRRMQLQSMADQLFDAVMEDELQNNRSFYTSSAMAAGVRMTAKGRHSEQEVARAMELARQKVYIILEQSENGDQ